jgi:hypothetical protein
VPASLRQSLSSAHRVGAGAMRVQTRVACTCVARTRCGMDCTTCQCGTVARRQSSRTILTGRGPERSACQRPSSLTRLDSGAASALSALSPNWRARFTSFPACRVKIASVESLFRWVEADLPIRGWRAIGMVTSAGAMLVSLAHAQAVPTIRVAFCEATAPGKPLRVLVGLAVVLLRWSERS